MHSYLLHPLQLGMSCRQTSCENWKDESFSIDYPENVFSISAIVILEFFLPFVNRYVIYIPKKYCQKNSLPENTTKLGGKSLNLFRFYPTPKARQIEKILNCHILLGMLGLLQNQIPSQTIYP